MCLRPATHNMPRVPSGSDLAGKARQGRRGSATTKTQAFTVLDAMLADSDILFQHTNDVSMAFMVQSALPNAPTCLLLDLEEGMRPAPALAFHAQQQPSLTATQRLLEASSSDLMEAAACLSQPVILEENSAEILRAEAAALAQEQEQLLQLRYASEVQLMEWKGQRAEVASHLRGTKRRDSMNERFAVPEVKRVMEELIHAHSKKNRLVLEGSHEVLKPNDSCQLLQPDHAYLLSSCLGSLSSMDASSSPTAYSMGSLSSMDGSSSTTAYSMDSFSSMDSSSPTASTVVSLCSIDSPPSPCRSSLDLAATSASSPAGSQSKGTLDALDGGKAEA